jgi:hypothetical protein
MDGSRGCGRGGLDGLSLDRRGFGRRGLSRHGLSRRGLGRLSLGGLGLGGLGLDGFSLLGGLSLGRLVTVGIIIGIVVIPSNIVLGGGGCDGSVRECSLGIHEGNSPWRRSRRLASAVSIPWRRK